MCSDSKTHSSIFDHVADLSGISSPGCVCGLSMALWWERTMFQAQSRKERLVDRPAQEAARRGSSGPVMMPF